MEKIEFLDYAELGEYIYELAIEDKKTVSVVMFRNDIVGLLRWLMEYDEIDLGHIEIKDEIIDGYGKEYYLTLDKNLNVEIEPVYEEDTKTIISCYADIVLFDGNASSRIAIENENCEQIEISLPENDDDEDSCGECACDCTNCPKAMSSQAIAGTLSFIDYLLNHIDD